MKRLWLLAYASFGMLTVVILYGSALLDHSHTWATACLLGWGLVISGGLAVTSLIGVLCLEATKR